MNSPDDGTRVLIALLVVPKACRLPKPVVMVTDMASGRTPAPLHVALFSRMLHAVPCSVSGQVRCGR